MTTLNKFSLPLIKITVSGSFLLFFLLPWNSCWCFRYIRHFFQCLWFLSMWKKKLILI